MSKPLITLVAAMGRNRVIGDDFGLPWKLPADMARFRRLTLGKPIILGRKTAELIGRVLPDRRNIVLSRTPHPGESQRVWTTSVPEALQACDDAAEVMVVGGAEVYRLFLPLADRMELTIVEGDFTGEATFPLWDVQEWEETASRSVPADERNAFAQVWLSLVRRPLVKLPLTT
jgi:dihydrofolate reductase